LFKKQGKIFFNHELEKKINRTRVLQPFSLGIKGIPLFTKRKKRHLEFLTRKELQLSVPIIRAIHTAHEPQSQIKQILEATTSQLRHSFVKKKLESDQTTRTIQRDRLMLRKSLKNRQHFAEIT